MRDHTESRGFIDGSIAGEIPLAAKEKIGRTVDYSAAGTVMWDI